MYSCLNDLLHVPPGGWKYLQEQSGLEIFGGDYYDLREKVRQHRLINRYVTGPELDSEIQSQICSKLPADARATFCRDCQWTATTRSLALGDIRHFLKVAKSWAVKPSFVSQAEANRRAEICAGCPKNLPIAGCRSCQNLVKWTLQLIGHKSTPFDEKLGGCEVCGCGNQAQVHLPQEVLAKGITPEMDFPLWCWKAKSSSLTSV
jgi:hypothetical protein